MSREELSGDVLIAAPAGVENHYWEYVPEQETDVLMSEEEAAWAATAP